MFLIFNFSLFLVDDNLVLCSFHVRFMLFILCFFINRIGYLTTEKFYILFFLRIIIIVRNNKKHKKHKKIINQILLNVLFISYHVHIVSNNSEIHHPYANSFLLKWFKIVNVFKNKRDLLMKKTFLVFKEVQKKVFFKKTSIERVMCLAKNKIKIASNYLATRL